MANEDIHITTNRLAGERDYLLNLVKRIYESGILLEPSELCDPKDRCEDCDLIREIGEKLGIENGQ